MSWPLHSSVNLLVKSLKSFVILLFFVLSSIATILPVAFIFSFAKFSLSLFREKDFRSLVEKSESRRTPSTAKKLKQLSKSYAWIFNSDLIPFLNSDLLIFPFLSASKILKTSSKESLRLSIFSLKETTTFLTFSFTSLKRSSSSSSVVGTASLQALSIKMILEKSKFLYRFSISSKDLIRISIFFRIWLSSSIIPTDGVEGNKNMSLKM